MSPVELTWLGQSTLVVRMDDDVVVIDAFFTEFDLRTYRAPKSADLPADATVFLCTHMHGDHFDAPALRSIAAERKIEIVVPTEGLTRARQEVPAASIRGLDAGVSIGMGRMRITGISVVHGDEPADAYHTGGYLGLIIEAAGYPLVFHGGDLIPSAHMLDAVKARRPHIMALPINGRDWYRERRGFVGCMSAEEAAITAIDCGADFVIPLHYDAVKGNGADPADLVRHVRARDGAVSVLVPPRNKPILVGVPA